MKLLFINLYSGNLERGAETFTHELIRHLQHYHSVTLICGKSSLQPQSQFSGSPLHQIRKRLFLDSPGLQVLSFSLRQLPRLLKSDYQVIFPLNGFWQLLLIKLLQPLKHYRIIVTGHSGPGWDERWNLWLKPTYFVATTQPTQNWAQKIAPWTKSVLIPYAIDFSRFQVKPVKLNLPHPIILCPAALVPYKRIDLAIQAVSKLQTASLLVLGQGPLQTKLHHLGRQLLRHRFLLTSTSQENIPRYYQAADIVTLPSDPQENSPMVFLEALAAQKPIVTTDTPRNRWLLKRAAIFINPQNIPSYSQALSQAQSIKSSQIHSALSQFSWDLVTHEYLKILQP